MAVIHTVIFGYKPEVSQSERDAIYQRFLGLKTLTKDVNGQPYIVDITGGKENLSKEQLAKGLDAAFIVTFKNFADRDYYVNTDPDHAAFVQEAGPKIANGYVHDFEV
ncbi:hypothetical protein FA10DRAFT_299184 [Acaromyces ingoldii]|uniref:Stress-response A/B barrel domain-containing protein n=1 Tax=Acaromyces ingoldii TaxID=215250 RepID=A0A316Z0J9_9BASI|nr:hypothetical protein FA10DRAFT_299184 [Acaromyces ingoldii]PWN93843.1 hypothetical protein FA10DRAFT_299184 [Acaromyces ingoldii]